MSFRYKIKILKKDKVINTTQLFGDNDYIKEIHDYIKNKFNLDLDNDEPIFEVELSKDNLNELYKIVDNYCLELAQNEKYRYIDTLKDYNKDYLNDFGLNNLNVLNSYYILESAYLCKFLLSTKGIDNFCCPFNILKGYKILFSYI